MEGFGLQHIGDCTRAGSLTTSTGMAVCTVTLTTNKHRGNAGICVTIDGIVSMGVTPHRRRMITGDSDVQTVGTDDRPCQLHLLSTLN